MLAGSPEASLSESWPHTHGCVHTNTPTQRPRPSVGWELHWTPRCGCARAVTVHGQSWGLTSPASGLEMMQSFTNSSFLMHGQNKRKIKKLYIHLKSSQKKKVLGFFLNYSCGGTNAFHVSKMQWFISLGTQKANLLRVQNGSNPSSPVRGLHAFPYLLEKEAVPPERETACQM